AGPIVAVDRFAIDPAWDRLALDAAAFMVFRQMLQRLATPLADIDKPLPRTDATWDGRRRTRKEFTALCRLPENATDDEFARRLRAVGEGPDHALTIARHGRTFRLESG